jgi:hypothetical protein
LLRVLVSFRRMAETCVEQVSDHKAFLGPYVPLGRHVADSHPLALFDAAHFSNGRFYGQVNCSRR